MSLITEINRTETNKNKTKQVAINIDNKLVELGGEQAIDLSDVPNKIQEMVKDYRRVAILQPTQSYTIKWTSINAFTVKSFLIPLNINFTPKFIIAHLTIDDTVYGEGIKNVTVFSEKNFKIFNKAENAEVAREGNLYLTIPKGDITKDKFTLRIGILNGGARTFVVDYIMAIE